MQIDYDPMKVKIGKVGKQLDEMIINKYIARYPQFLKEYQELEKIQAMEAIMMGLDLAVEYMPRVLGKGAAISFLALVMADYVDFLADQEGNTLEPISKYEDWYV